MSSSRHLWKEGAMLRILGHEFKHFLRGGRWLFLLLPIISAAFFIWLGGQGVLSSVTADQAVTSANTYCLAAGCCVTIRHSFIR